MAAMGYELLAEATKAVSCSVDEQAGNEVSLGIKGALSRAFRDFWP